MFINKPSIVKYTVAGNTVFPFEFKFYRDTDVKVWYVPPGETPDDVTHLLLLGTDYTVSSDVSMIGGSIAILIPMSDGGLVTVARILPTTRTIDYADRGAFKAQTMDQDQNYQTYLMLDQLSYSNFFLRSPTSGVGTGIVFPPPLSEAYIRWNLAGDNLENDTEPPTWRNETLALRNETEVLHGETEAFRNEASQSATDAEASHQATLLVEPVVIAQGDTQVALVAQEGTNQVAIVIAEGDTQVARVIGYVDESEDSAGEALASQLTSDAWANTSVDTDVIEWTWDAVNDTLIQTPLPGMRSSVHWMEQAKLVASGLSFQGTWVMDAVCTLPPAGVENGEFYIINQVDPACTTYHIGDWIIWNGATWQQVQWSFSWSTTSDVTVEGALPAVADDLARASSLANYLLKTGGTMSGHIDLNNEIAIRSKLAGGSLIDLILVDSIDQIIIGSSAQLLFFHGLSPLFEHGIPRTNTVQGTAVNELTRKDYVDGRVVEVTQAEYDALTPDETVMYAIIG